MKRFKQILLIIALIFIFPLNVFAKEDNNVRLYLFHKDSCPHCQDEIEFLDKIKGDYPTLEIITYEVENNEMNYNFYRRVIEKTGLNVTGVPFTIIGTDYYVGFSDAIGKSIKKDIEKYLNSEERDVVLDVKNEVDVNNIVWNANPEDIVDVPGMGNVNAKAISLPILAITLGTLDGFNPCAMWVLLFLISMLFNMKDKKKMWTLGIVFLATSALIYLLFMAAWLKVAVSFSSIKWIRILIALVALIGSYVNISSYMKARKNDAGCEVVDENKRKKIFARIKEITLEKKFILSILGIMALAISVNMIELACSAGLPLIFTQVLALNDLSTFKYVIYLLLYIFFFLLDDMIIFTVAMLTLNIKGISSKYGKYSHLIGGIVMFIIAVLMIFKPEWLMFNFK